VVPCHVADAAGDGLAERVLWPVVHQHRIRHRSCPGWFSNRCRQAE
jgi:hypothetical protein